MKTITVFNQAGGVGKTTLALNLGYHLARQGARVLLVDLDPQASLTTFLGFEPDDLETTLYEALMERSPLPIIGEVFGMALVPSNITLAGAEQELVSALGREARLKRVLDPAAASFDLVVVDCPPSLGLLAVLGLAAADYILVPVQTQYKAYKGTDQLLGTIDGVRRNLNPRLQILGFVPMQYEKGRVHDRQALEAIQTQLRPRAEVLEPIPRAEDFKNATMAHQPLALFNPHNPTVEVLEGLARGLLGQIGGGQGARNPDLTPS